MFFTSFSQKTKEVHVPTQHCHEVNKFSVFQPKLIVVPVPLVESAYPVAFGPGSSPSLVCVQLVGEQCFSSI